MSNTGNVAGGLKAAISNPNVSSDAKERAQERLDNEDFGTSTELDAETTDHQKNPGNVIGGLKAALKNPNVGEAKKEEIQSKLEGGI